MSCEIYVWLPEGTNVGHSSMDAGGTYISFWPHRGSKRTEQIFGTTAAYPQGYSNDCMNEGRSASSIITLNYLWEERIKDYWRAMQKAGWHYTATSLNCSTIIANCLYIGSGVAPSFTVDANEYISFLQLQGVWTPRYVREYAYELKNRE